MKKLLRAGFTLAVIGLLAHTSAVAQQAKPSKKPAATQVVKSTKSAGARAALCKADCTPGKYQASGVGVHGIYRSYAQFDPHLTSLEGRASFNDCVRICMAPLPTHWYAQKAVFALGFNWFGNSPKSCLNCHESGHYK